MKRISRRNGQKCCERYDLKMNSNIEYERTEKGMSEKQNNGRHSV